MPSRLLAASLIALMLQLLSSPACSQRLDWKLEDFQPLTELPWDETGTKPLRVVLTRIFRESDIQIRYPVLASYLRKIPMGQLSEAFDLCVTLEGTQTPGMLVDFFIRIWAERDPAACWIRVQSILKLVGIEHGWMNYDSWEGRDTITVRDAEALQTSPFWLEHGNWLLSFPFGVEASSLTVDEKARMYRAFADLWISEFKSWPATELNIEFEAGNVGGGYHHKADALLAMFLALPDSVRLNAGAATSPDARASIELGLRRWLKFEPAAAKEILARRKSLFPLVVDGSNGVQPSPPPIEWLMIWRQVDRPAMVDWADSLDPNDPLTTSVRGMLLSSVDEHHRSRWINQATEQDDLRTSLESLLYHWGSWDPGAASEFALKSKNFALLTEATEGAAYGPFIGAWNTCHPGLGFVRDFELHSFCKEFPEHVRDEWGVTIMEQWGDVDVGEAAQYGLRYMLNCNYTPRENLLKLFLGDDRFSSDSDMIDRTFCALRAWAVLKPRAMKRWIATLRDPEMEKALTWLLENPWGGKLNPKD